MGQRSRKRRREGARPRVPAAERDEQIRQELEPLDAGERPGAVTAGAVVAVLLAIANTIALLLGEQVGGDDARISAVGFTVILLVAAWGMWKAKYWAVLGFEALLAIQVVLAALALSVASSWWVAVVCVAIIGFGGWLFWKLVRALARLQMPDRRPQPRDV